MVFKITRGIPEVNNPIAGLRVDPRERRLTEQLILYWNKIRNEKHFPDYNDVKPDDIKNLWENCFTVEITNENGRIAHDYVHIGKNITGMFSGDLSGETALPLMDTLAMRYLDIVDSKKPKVSEGDFFNEKNMEIRYRQILLPFGSVEDTIDHIVGGMRYKKFRI